jgi:hypothetical protein
LNHFLPKMISPVEFEKKHSTPLEVDSSKKKMKSFSLCNASQTLMYMNSNRRIRIDRAMHMSDEMQTNRRERGLSFLRKNKDA